MVIGSRERKWFIFLINTVCEVHKKSILVILGGESQAFGPSLRAKEDEEL